MVPQKWKHTHTDTQTHRHTDRRTFRLIESIGPEGRCFENPMYRQHSALLYVSDSRVPIIYHESKSLPWVQVYTVSPTLYHEPKFLPWAQVYTMSPSLYHESKFIPWVQVNTMNPSLYHTRRFRKKSNFKVEQIQFHVERNPIAYWKKFIYTL